MLLRKQKSAGANLSLFPSWFPFYGFVVPFRCLVRFTNVVTSGMVPPSRGWKRGCRDLKWFPLPCRAYVSRKREILQSRPILSPCNYSHNLSPSRSSDFSVNPFWNLLTNFTPTPHPPVCSLANFPISTARIFPWNSNSSSRLTLQNTAIIRWDDTLPTNETRKRGDINFNIRRNIPRQGTAVAA